MTGRRHKKKKSTGNDDYGESKTKSKKMDVDAVPVSRHTTRDHQNINTSGIGSGKIPKTLVLLCTTTHLLLKS